MKFSYYISLLAILGLLVNWASAQSQYIQNPIIPGFNPDPDIIRVGDDYYIATTTFEWYPSVNLYHSKDLVNWRQLPHPLGEEHINLEGVPNSGGNYIPSLLFNKHDSLFYLVYSNVLGRDWPLMSMQSFVTTAKDIEGPWSPPVLLGGAGFDPAFFIDDDGRTYLISMVLDYRTWVQMPGFLLQEYNTNNKQLVEAPKMIFNVRDYDEKLWSMYPEGPHIYKKEGYYYLLFATGGTYWTHQSWMARSKNIWGPYELNPDNPVLTSIGSEAGSLQKAGQGGLVETQDGEWYMSHHVSRPLLPDSVSPLGRETCLQKVEWNEASWLELSSGGKHPQEKVTAPNLPPYPFDNENTNYDFEEAELPLAFQSLRSPMKENWVSLKRKKGKLSIRGRQPITSLIGQSLIARRWVSLDFEVETGIDFQPKHYLQMAGLTLFYDTEDFQYAYISHDEKLGRVVRLMRRSRGKGLERFNEIQKDIPEKGTIRFKAKISEGKSQFFFATEKGEWQKLGEPLSINHLSDEGTDGNKNGFTGAFMGISVQDRLHEKTWAEVGYFYLDGD